MEARREEAEEMDTWVQDSLMRNLKEEPDLEVTTAKMTFYEHESIANSNYYGANYAGHRNMNQQQQQFYPKHQNYGNIAYDNTAAYNNHSPSYQSNRGGDEYRQQHHQQQYSAQTNDTVFLTAEGSPHVSDHSMRWQRRDKEHHHHHNHQQQQQETTLANNINHMGACTGEAYYHSTTYPHAHQQEGSNEAFLYSHPQQHYVEEKDRSRGCRPLFPSESYHHDDNSFVLDDSMWNDLEPIGGHPPMHAFHSYATSPEAAVTARTYSQGVSIHGSEAERKMMLKRSISEPHVSSAAANFSQKRSRKLEIQVDPSIPSPNATITTTADARISGARPVRPIVRRKSSPRTRALDSFSEFAQMAKARVQLSQDQIDRFFEVVYTLRNIDQGFDEELDQRLKRTFTWNENAALLLCSFLQEGDRTPFKGILQQFNRALVDQVQDAKTSPRGKSLLKDLRPIRDRSSLRKRLQKLLGSEQLTKYWANTRRVAAAYFVHMVVQACRENETAAQGAQHEYEDDATTSTTNTDAHYSPRSEVSSNTARPQKAKHDLPVQKPYLNPGLVAELEEISTLMRNCYEDLDLYMPPDSAEPKTPLGTEERTQVQLA